MHHIDVKYMRLSMIEKHPSESSIPTRSESATADYYARTFFPEEFCLIGIVIVNVVPSPSLLFTVIFPPCRSTILRQTLNSRRAWVLPSDDCFSGRFSPRCRNALALPFYRTTRVRRCRASCPGIHHTYSDNHFPKSPRVG